MPNPSQSVVAPCDVFIYTKMQIRRKKFSIREKLIENRDHELSLKYTSGICMNEAFLCLFSSIFTRTHVKYCSFHCLIENDGHKMTEAVCREPMKLSFSAPLVLRPLPALEGAQHHVLTVMCF